jgi:hypothetical protein
MFFCLDGISGVSVLDYDHGAARKPLNLATVCNLFET